MMQLSNDLLNNLGYSSPDSEDAFAHPSVVRRNRRSKFDPFRQEILTLSWDGKSLGQILRRLKSKYPDIKLPVSRSQLLRFIKKCHGATR